MKLLDDSEMDIIIEKQKLSNDKISKLKDEIKNEGVHNICLITARNNYLQLLKEFRSLNFPWDVRVSSIAAREGHLQMLKWMKGNNCPWDSETCKSTVEGDHKSVLVWAKNSGCPWDYTTTETAAKEGNYKILLWAIVNKCEWTPDIWPTLFRALIQAIKDRAIKDRAIKDRAIKDREIKDEKDKPSVIDKKDEDVFDQKDKEVFDQKEIELVLNETGFNYKEKNWVFRIFLWADNLNLIASEDKWIVKIIKFVGRIPSKMKLIKLRNKIKLGRKEVFDQSFRPVKAMAEEALEKQIKPFFWLVFKRKNNFYVENPDFDSSENYQNDDKIVVTLDKLLINGDKEVKPNDTAEEEATDAAKEDISDDLVEPGDNEIDPLMLRDEEREQMEADVSNGTLEYSSQVQNWYNNSDNRYKRIFVRVINKLKDGRESYSVAKPLQGSKNLPILEAKLDKGQRILWTKIFPQMEDYIYEQKDSNNKSVTEKIKDDDEMLPRLFIWHVCKHDNINKDMALIDQSFGRVGIKSQRGFSAHLIKTQILVEPKGNACMKIYSTSFSDIEEAISKKKIPKSSLRLTREEKAIINRKGGSVMVFGRSGTGKTICLTDKMRSDRQLNSTISQLFVARNPSLCNVVKSYQQNTDSSYESYANKFTFLTFKTFMDEMYRKVRDYIKQERNTIEPKVFEEKQRVSSTRFKQEIWPEIKPSNCSLVPTTVWTQIHSFLKGSVEVIVKRQIDEKHNVEYVSNFKHLTLEEYLNEEVFPFERCRLTLPQRDEAHKLFKGYQQYLSDKNLWDDSDKALYILENSKLDDVLVHKHTINFNFTQMQNETSAFYYDKVYIDEVQDFTQAETLLFFLAAGMYSNLFMVGDTAQAVEEAVSFRFQEIRSLVHKVCNDYIGKPLKLKVNFRSHKGILNLAVNVIDKLKIAFGQSIELDSDEVGLLLGPIAAVCPFPKEVNNARNNRSKAKDLFENSCKRIRDIATYHQTAFFLTPESNVQRLNGIIGEENPMVLSIVDSKGLEFFEVVIVDFFSSIPPADRSAWKKLFTLKPGDQLGDFPYPQIESQLKNLYVAITRARNRLIFIETGLYDVYKNGTGFEVVESVWKAWSIQVNKENSSNSEEAKETLIEKFDADLEANKDLVGKNPRELAAGALTFIEKALDVYHTEKDIQNTNDLLTRAHLILSKSSDKVIIDRLTTQMKVFSDEVNDKRKASMVLRDCIKHGLYDNSSILVKKILEIDDDDDYPTDEDIESDDYDSETEIDKLIKDDVIGRLINLLNFFRKAEQEQRNMPDASQNIQADKDYDLFTVKETLAELTKLKASVSKNMKRKVKENRKIKLQRAIEEKTEIKNLKTSLKNKEIKKPTPSPPQKTFTKYQITQELKKEKITQFDLKLKELSKKDENAIQELKEAERRKEVEKRKVTDTEKRKEEERKKKAAEAEKRREEERKAAEQKAERKAKKAAMKAAAKKASKKGDEFLPTLRDIDSDSSESDASSTSSSSSSSSSSSDSSLRREVKKVVNKARPSRMKVVNSDSDEDDVPPPLITKSKSDKAGSGKVKKITPNALRGYDSDSDN